MVMITVRQSKLIRDISAIIICACILAASTFINWNIIVDRFLGFGFEPTTEMSNLKTDLDLTARARIIFFATQPAIKDRRAFNQACSSSVSEVSILGCYDGRFIFLYDINNPELAGIKQSTLAHELLHAAWDRLSTSDRSRLEPDLDAIYEANFDSLQSRLKLYPESSFYDELHSIAGTEFASLSDNLKKHYAEYFNDQNVVVSFFDKYNIKFKELKAEAEALYEQIDINQELIKAKVANYDDAVNDLAAAIIDFNRRAESGYFTSTAAFNAERATLIARQQELERLYNEIAALADDTNGLIEQYNNNIARTQLLLDSVNSNAPPTPEV
ncbi:hypothetical protein FWF89_01065 [Candidatus Saccharibacteria bacterium]|nr:hypothetical protein [Candidatus Saccharibacteria bacterium]